MKVKGNHPLAEVIARKLSGIEMVPTEEQRRMVNRACRAAIDWYENSSISYEKTKNAPRHIKDAVKHHPDFPKEIFKCPDCGRWWTELDHCFPYHQEQNYCKYCDD